MSTIQPSDYVKDLRVRLKKKEEELESLYKQRANDIHKENFYNLQSGINKTQVDIQTIKSRIENVGKRGIVLPDHDNNIAVNRIK